MAKIINLHSRAIIMAPPLVIDRAFLIRSTSRTFHLFPLLPTELKIQILAYHANTSISLQRVFQVVPAQQQPPLPTSVSSSCFGCSILGLCCQVHLPELELYGASFAASIEDMPSFKAGDA